jgi:RimJ/RimL family protein N-acetyltransferase
MDIPTPEPPNPPPFEAIRDIFFAGNTFDQASSIVAVRDGRIVGVTVTTKNGDIAYTGYTGVRREARGQGLALAMKLKALAALRKSGATMFGTTNDEANAAMRGINARLGYVADPPLTQVEKRFT